MTTENISPFAMSDEDFLKLSAPPVVEAPVIEEPVKENVDPPVVEQVEQKTDVDPPLDPENKEPEKEVETSADEEAAKVKQEDGGEPAKQAEAKTDPAKTEASTDPNKKLEPEKKEEPVAQPINYQESYEKIMAPFKANGKEIKLNSPEEAIKLMQMGANYTRKMQELAPNMKLVTMLQNNSINQDELSYLIDLKNKNPEAIKKLVKDSGIDPLDINTAEPSSYKPKDHSVDDRQVAFNSKIEDFKSTESGMQTLVEINNNWDDLSKEALWNSPELMDVFHTQRENGIYDQITTEMERQRTLGLIPRTIPFIEAYKRVGDHMQANNLLVAKEAPKLEPVATNRVVANKVDPNAERVKAAATVKETPAKKQEAINYLAMDDEAFLKQMAGRL